jgi:hypothetical protein
VRRHGVDRLDLLGRDEQPHGIRKSAQKKRAVIRNNRYQNDKEMNEGIWSHLGIKERLDGWTGLDARLREAIRWDEAECQTRAAFGVQFSKRSSVGFNSIFRHNKFLLVAKSTVKDCGFIEPNPVFKTKVALGQTVTVVAIYNRNRA